MRYLSIGAHNAAWLNGAQNIVETSARVGVSRRLPSDSQVQRLSFRLKFANEYSETPRSTLPARDPPPGVSPRTRPPPVLLRSSLASAPCTWSRHLVGAKPRPPTISLPCRTYAHAQRAWKSGMRGACIIP